MSSQEFIWENIIKDNSNQESIDQFKSFFTEKKCTKGEFLINQGDEGAELYIIKSGKFDVFIHTVDDVNHLIRVRSMSPGSIFGETVLYGNLKRMASVRAEEDSCIFVLSKNRVAEMEKEFPHLAISFHRTIAATMSERLSSLNRLISRLDP